MPDNMAAFTPAMVAPTRPVLIDESDGPCEICAGWGAAKHTLAEDGRTTIYHCDQCGAAIPDMGLMRGRGFDSIVPHHFHLRGIGPAQAPGRAGVHQELCPACYRAHRKAVYPNESPELLEKRLKV